MKQDYKYMEHYYMCYKINCFSFLFSFPSNIPCLQMQVRPQAGFLFVMVSVILVAMWLHSMR